MLLITHFRRPLLARHRLSTTVMPPFPSSANGVRVRVCVHARVCVKGEGD